MLQFKPWTPPTLTPADIAAAEKEVLQLPNERYQLANEIRSDAMHARRDCYPGDPMPHCQAVDGELARVMATITKLSLPEQLLMLRSAQEHFAGLRKLQEETAQAFLRREKERIDRQRHEELFRINRLSRNEIETKAVAEALDRLVMRAKDLQGKLPNTDDRAAWRRELKEALSSCFASVDVALRDPKKEAA